MFLIGCLNGIFYIGTILFYKLLGVVDLIQDVTPHPDASSFKLYYVSLIKVELIICFKLRELYIDGLWLYYIVIYYLHRLAS